MGGGIGVEEFEAYGLVSFGFYGFDVKEHPLLDAFDSNLEQVSLPVKLGILLGFLSLPLLSFLLGKQSGDLGMFDTHRFGIPKLTH